MIEKKYFKDFLNSIINSKKISEILILAHNELSKLDKITIIDYAGIINYLNEKAGKNFRLIDTNKRLINARVKEGFTLDDFKSVIDVKCKQWLKDRETVRYLRPITLFSTKFESYLNEAPVRKKIVNPVSDAQEKIMSILKRYEDLPGGKKVHTWIDKMFKKYEDEYIEKIYKSILEIRKTGLGKDIEFDSVKELMEAI